MDTDIELDGLCTGSIPRRDYIRATMYLTGEWIKSGDETPEEYSQFNIRSFMVYLCACSSSFAHLSSALASQ